MLELDNVSKFFDAISSDEELSRRIETALANYPGSLEMREFLVEDILFPIAEELGLPFTLTELMGFEAKLKAQRQEEIASHDADPDFEIPEYSYWLLDRGWSNEESKFCGDK